MTYDKKLDEAYDNFFKRKKNVKGKNNEETAKNIYELYGIKGKTDADTIYDFLELNRYLHIKEVKKASVERNKELEEEVKASDDINEKFNYLLGEIKRLEGMLK